MISSESLQLLKDQLLQMEGFRGYPYMDTMGNLTIGIGRNLKTNGISEDEAQYMLNNDIMKCQTMLAAALPWFTELDEIRQICLINMCFNLGIDKFLEFKEMLDALSKHDYTTAAQAMQSSLWYRQLSNRVTILSHMMASGEMKG